jgi:ATP-binding protein involved in chromosome partitioning
MSTVDQIRAALATVEEPELHKDIVSLNMVKGVTFENGSVGLIIELTTPACPMKDELESRIQKAVKKVSGVTSVAVEFTARVNAARPVTGKMPIEGVKNVIAVYACKGGVGKSTVASNLATALAQRGAKVGLLDADIYGPNIPIMMGTKERPQGAANNKIAPIVAHGVKLMSLGFLTDANTPMIWRGPMVHGAVQQLLRETAWDDIDYLVVDLPPGTGDAQLTLIQSVPLAGVVFVSTPQAVCLADGVKGIEMFRKLNVPILGLVENMSGFECPECHHTTDIFSKGGGETEAQRYDIPFLGAIPIDPRIVQGGDTGKPIVVGQPNTVTAKAFMGLAERVAANVSIAQLTEPASTPA